MRSLAATMVLKVSQILPATPIFEPGRRTEKSPACMAFRASSSSLRLSSGEAIAAALAECPFALRLRATL
jgi:hypothetical protein